jgi:hypothetical protein
LLCAAGAVHAQELGSWVPSTDRRVNPLIGEILLAPPTADRLEAARALGQRSDPYVSDLIGSLLGRLHGGGTYEDALVLRVMLDAVFDRSLLPKELQRRAVENRAGLELLAESLPSFDAALARETYRLLALGADRPLVGVLMREGRALGEDLQRRRGRSDAEQADRLMAYLEAAAAAGDGELAEPVVAILEHTRTREVAHYARQVLAAILPRD